MEVNTNKDFIMRTNSMKNYVPIKTSIQYNTPKTIYPEELSNKKKLGIGLLSAAGAGTSLLLLAKFDKTHKYSINPLKMLKCNFKDSYLMNTSYKTKEIISIGAGSILGGLVGGAIFNKNGNKSARHKEAITQIINVSFPIAFVEGAIRLGENFSKKIMPAFEKSKNILQKTTYKLPSVIGATLGLMMGVYTGNKLSNKINEKIFKEKDTRPIKLTDFSAHVDDMCVAATLIDDKNIVTKSIQKLIPLALVIPGYETGIKK